MSTTAPVRASSLAHPGVPPRGTALVAGWESTYLTSVDLDGIEVSGHALGWRTHLSAVAGTGVTHVRYPLRWHRIEPAPGQYCWSATDEVLHHIVGLGLAPIVDLLHHTSYPAWLTDGFADPRFGDAFVAFAEAVADRYGSLLHAYTLVNEPFITAFFCGHQALWPPHGRGVPGFVRMLRTLLPPLARAAASWRERVPHAAHVWVDSAEHHDGVGRGRDHADLCNDRRHVVLDLFLGQHLAGDRPFLREVLRAGGEDLLELPHGAVDVVGLDYYPHSEWFYDDHRGHAPSPRPVGLAHLVGEYAARYGAPLMVTETNIRGLPSDRVSWLRHVLEQCEQAVEAGRPLHGVCWFPHLDSHDWDSLLTLYRGRPDPVGVLGWTSRGGTAATLFTTAWQAVAAGARSAELPAYRWQPPCDTQLRGFLPLMTGWPWQDPPAHERAAARHVPSARPGDGGDEGGTMRTTNARDLVVISHLRWTWVWQRPQHLVSRLATERARHGRGTWFVEEPAEGDVAAPVLHTQEQDGVTRVWLEVPRGLAGGGHLSFDHPAARDYGPVLGRLLREHGVAAPDAWMYTPMGVDLLGHLRPARVVYDVMDDLASFRFAPAGLRERQHELLRTADLVFTGGRSLHEGVTAHRTQDVHLFPSGVESSHYAAARALRQRHDPPVAGYVGVIDERLDLSLVAELAALLPGWTIRLVGPTAKIDPATLPQAPNLEYPGMTAYDELPDVMAGFDVALMPFALNEATRAISPTKTLEYLAAGLPVISTRVPDVVRNYGEVVHLADDARSFAAGCEHVLTHGPEERDRLAEPLLRQQEWDTIAAEMAGRLEMVPGPSGSLAHDLDDAHQLGVAAAANGLQDAALGRQRLTGAGVEQLAAAAVASATPFVRAPLMSRMWDVRRLHPRVGTTCPTCGTATPCATAEALT